MNTKIDHCTLFVDGAARNNPGPAGIGVCLLVPGKPAIKHGFFIGDKTNNQAEYIALIVGLLYAKKHAPCDGHLEIYSDSQLLVRQVRQEYRVKDAHLKVLHAKVLALLDGMHVTVSHVLREHNEVADELANKGIDQKIMLPEVFLRVLQQHGIPF